MTDQITLAIVAGGFALGGSLITGWFTYRAAASQKTIERHRRMLNQAYHDIAAFHRLEEKYTSALATESKSAAAWKKEVRKQLRDEGFPSPSEDATALRAESRLHGLI